MIIVLIVILFCIQQVRATVDLTLPELQHLAEHLSKDECRRLVAALHFNSFDLDPSRSLADAENALPKDVTCLKLLLEWNSDEGKGKTHEKLSLRLRQIGRQDLASWLDSAVIIQLQGELDKEIQELTESHQDQNTATQVFENHDDSEEKFIKNDERWSFVTSFILFAFIIVSLIILACLVNQVVRRYQLSKLEKTQNEKLKNVQ